MPRTSSGGGTVAVEVVVVEEAVDMLLLVDVVALLLVAETTVDDCTVANAVDGDALASVRAAVPSPQPAIIKTETASAAVR